MVIESWTSGHLDQSSGVSLPRMCSAVEMDVLNIVWRGRERVREGFGAEFWTVYIWPREVGLFSFCRIVREEGGWRMWASLLGIGGYMWATLVGLVECMWASLLCRELYMLVFGLLSLPSDHLRYVCIFNTLTLRR